MATFAGHVVPGLIFALCGVYWSFTSIFVYFKTGHRTTKESDISSQVGHSSPLHYDPKRLAWKSWIPSPCLSRVPFEPLLKVLITSVGIAEELFIALDEKRHPVLFLYSPFLKNGLLNVQPKFMHITMYSVLMLSGVVDLLSLCAKLPKHMPTVVFSLVFYAESLVFYIHGVNKHEFDSIVHFLLQFAIIPCGVFTLLRLYDPTNLMINLGFSTFLTLQGTWLIQIAFLVFTDKFPLTDEGMIETTTMFSAAIFAWHIVAIIVFNVTLLLLLQFLTDKSSKWIRQSGICLSAKFLKGGWKGMLEERSQLVKEESKDSEIEDMKIA